MSMYPSGKNKRREPPKRKGRDEKPPAYVVRGYGLDDRDRSPRRDHRGSSSPRSPRTTSKALRYVRDETDRVREELKRESAAALASTRARDGAAAKDARAALAGRRPVSSRRTDDGDDEYSRGVETGYTEGAGSSAGTGRGGAAARTWRFRGDGFSETGAFDAAARDREKNRP